MNLHENAGFAILVPHVLRGAVAQLGERLNGIEEVKGSIPFSSTGGGSLYPLVKGGGGWPTACHIFSDVYSFCKFILFCKFVKFLNRYLHLNTFNFFVFILIIAFLVPF